MAVQAQYPSNILLLNRNGQERGEMIGEDYRLQAQTNGFLDQSAVFFTNGESNNQHKRGRETVVPSSAMYMNLPSLQSDPPGPPPPTLVNLAELHNQQPCLVSTGLCLSSEEQEQQQQQKEQQTGVFNPFPTLSSLFPEDLAALIKQQRDEIDQFLQAQADQLRCTLAERWGSHYRALLRATKECALRRLREKDAEIRTAAGRNAELVEKVARLKAEAHAWHVRAKSQEVAAAALQAQLQHAVMSQAAAQEEKGGAKDAASANVEPDRVVVPVCRACRKRAVSVVMLPCRHLCVCTECDEVVGACPTCQSARSATLQVYFK